MEWVAGVDGCHGGWIVVLRNANSRHEIRYRGPIRHLSSVLDLAEEPRIISVDIPIGLLECATRGGRECDKEARALLGQPRARSVFSPPARAALRQSEYSAALAANRATSPERVGISKQCFGLFDKIRQVDEWIDADKQLRIREVHPELCFWKIKGEVAMPHGKKEAAGLKLRRELLIKEGFGAVIENARNETSRRDVKEDDILDACAACWTAERILLKRASVVPETGDGPKIWY